MGNYKLSNGEAGNRQTINIMSLVARKRSSHPLIRQMALQVLHDKAIESQNHISEAIALGEFVQAKIVYRRDIDNIEQLQDPLKIAQDINARGVAVGDCDDMATFLAALLLSIGAQPKFRAVRYDSNTGHYNHIYVVVYDTNWGTQENRVVLDTILKRNKIGTEVPHINGEEFDI